MRQVEGKMKRVKTVAVATVLLSPLFLLGNLPVQAQRLVPNQPFWPDEPEHLQHQQEREQQVAANMQFVGALQSDPYYPGRTTNQPDTMRAGQGVYARNYLEPPEPHVRDRADLTGVPQYSSTPPGERPDLPVFSTQPVMETLPDEAEQWSETFDSRRFAPPKSGRQRQPSGPILFGPPVGVAGDGLEFPPLTDTPSQYDPRRGTAAGVYQRRTQATRDEDSERSWFSWPWDKEEESAASRGEVDLDSLELAINSANYRPPPPPTMEAGRLQGWSPEGDINTLISAGAEATVNKPFSLAMGDRVVVQVFGQDELGAEVIVSERGTVTLPLIGDVQVSGLSLVEAQDRIATALRDGGFVVDPKVNMLIDDVRSQQVSVLGAVNTPTRVQIDANTTVLDALAEARGVSDKGSDNVILIRRNGNRAQRYLINTKDMLGGGGPSVIALRAGDTIFVPKADVFYIYGEVNRPNVYRLEPDMTVMQALSVGGGLTERGSQKHVEIRRQGEFGRTETIEVGLSDPVEVGDVIYVRERLF